ncbi:MAG: efflux RND transporter periplasmic adaptor subunit [Microgenomates group bacterium]
MKIIKFFKKRKKIAILIIFLILLLGIILKAFLNKGKKPQYQTAKVERGTIVWSVSASGSVVTANIFEVTTQATGMVKKVYVKDGDKVKAGQKIMEIELDLLGKQKATSAWNAYLSAKNNLESAKATLWSLDSTMWQANQKFINDAVARELEPTDPTYIQQNDEWLAAEAKYKNQQQVIKQAESAVNNAWLAYQLVSPIVTAPVSGTISGLAYVPGMVIGSSSGSVGQRVAVIRTEGMPLASFNLSELDVPVVKVGQKAIIKIDSLPDKTFTGKVVSVDRLGATSNGVTNYPVIVQFDTTSDEVLPNMAASVNIIIETKDNVLMIPSSAIQKQGGQNIVTVLENKKEIQKPIEVGISSETHTEILSGLSEGEIVVVSKTSGATIPIGGSPFGGMPGGAFRMAR